MHPRHNISKNNLNQKLSQELLLEPDENVLYIVKKHPFGILVIVFGVVVGLLLIGISAVLAGISFSDSADTAPIFITAVGVVIGIILLIAIYIYFESRFVVTDKHIVQILQNGLFNRKTSQLSLLNVEDVTVEKNGIFATFFNFGTLTIETAGEQKNFIYTYCPNPNFYADAVLDARHSLINKQNINPADASTIAS